ncbi:hypothetical protein TrCOL_g5080 [Triparma columacea]|uniref:Uncharacterized protein n=1 Tax=Triparma columacea TaxID=722753 RepID=A0A9W7LAI5_9STRA|nr:hypothetical protein TrCOL_g5080 [Triparma columacea]
MDNTDNMDTTDGNNNINNDSIQIGGMGSGSGSGSGVSSNTRVSNTRVSNTPKAYTSLLSALALNVALSFATPGRANAAPFHFRDHAKEQTNYPPPIVNFEGNVDEGNEDEQQTDKWDTQEWDNADDDSNEGVSSDAPQVSSDVTSQDSSEYTTSSTPSSPGRLKSLKSGLINTATSTLSKLPPSSRGIVVGISASVTLAAGVKGMGYVRRRREEEEKKRLEQYRIIMGEGGGKGMGGGDKKPQEEEWMDLIDSSSTSTSSTTSVSVTLAPSASPTSPLPQSTLADVIQTTTNETQEELTKTTKESEGNEVKPSPPTPPAQLKTQQPTTIPPPPSPPKKKSFISIRSGLTSKKSGRETSITKLLGTTTTPPPKVAFMKCLTSYLTFGAPGRFLDLEDTLSTPRDFDLTTAVSELTSLRDEAGMTEQDTGEAFADVTHCMIVTIVDLAMSTLKSKDDTDVVKGLEVVLEFTDHAAGIYGEIVGPDVVVEPVVYGGAQGGKKLESMYKKYLGNVGIAVDEKQEERVDRLQAVLGIKDSKAQGIQQKVMMKKMMKMMKGMKGGGDDPEAMAKMMKEMGLDMEGMEGMEEMMKGMGGMGGMGGVDGKPPTQEELKESIRLMKELIDNDMVGEEEMKQVKEEFRKSMGTDIEELVRMAEEQERAGDLDEEGRELLELFKKVLN